MHKARPLIRLPQVMQPLQLRLRPRHKRRRRRKLRPRAGQAAILPLLPSSALTHPLLRNHSLEAYLRICMLLRETGVALANLWLELRWMLPLHEDKCPLSSPRPVRYLPQLRFRTGSLTTMMSGKLREVLGSGKRQLNKLQWWRSQR